jgi:hypothetical protein
LSGFSLARESAISRQLGWALAALSGAEWDGAWAAPWV